MPLIPIAHADIDTAELARVQFDNLAETFVLEIVGRKGDAPVSLGPDYRVTGALSDLAVALGGPSAIAAFKAALEAFARSAQKWPESNGVDLPVYVPPQEPQA